MNLGVATTDLHPRIKIHQEGFAEVSKRVESELAGQVTEHLIVKLRNNFPPEYQDALRLPTALDQSADTLRSQAATAQGFDVTDAAVEQAVREESARMRLVGDLPSSVTVGTPEGRPAPSESTPGQVENARRATAVSQTDTGVELASEGEKKIVLQVEKLVTEQLTKVIKPITDAIPIVEPLLLSFVEAVDWTTPELGSVCRSTLPLPISSTGSTERTSTTSSRNAPRSAGVAGHSPRPTCSNSCRPCATEALKSTGTTPRSWSARARRFMSHRNYAMRHAASVVATSLSFKCAMSAEGEVDVGR